MNLTNYNLKRKTTFALLTLLVSGLTMQSLRPVAAGETNPISQNTAAPELVGKTWINPPKGNPVTLAALKGKVTLLHFWTYGCINCKHNLPSYNTLYKKYAGQDIAFIGVHTPETPGESVVSNVITSVRRNHIAYPVLVDNKSLNWSRWNQQFWPTVYLLDKQGRIRYRWEGELEFNGQNGTQKLASLIDALKKEN